MRFRLVILAAIALLIGSGWALAQSTSDARNEGEALANDIRDATTDSILSAGSDAQVPGFGGTDFSESGYVDDPDGLTAAGEARRHDDGYRTIVDPHRPVFDPATIDLASAEIVAEDPDAFLGTGLGLAGESGSCEALPGGSGSPSTYYESCNAGTFADEVDVSCSVRRVVEVDLAYRYTCQTVQIYKPEERTCNRLGCTTTPEILTETVTTCVAAEADASCREVASSVSEDGPFYIYGRQAAYLRNTRTYTKTFECSEPHEPVAEQQSSTPYYTRFLARWTRPDLSSEQHWSAAAETLAGTTGSGATSHIDDSDCGAKTATLACEAPVETCVDSDPQSRLIDGVEVTHSCWEWQRSYACATLSARNDCSALEANSQCTYDRRECLSEDADGGCNVWDHWYRCTGPEGEDGSPDYVCAGDLYCIDGECTSVERQASTEFKDAMVAIQAMGELRDDFDEDTLRLFTGENLKCRKKLFGLANCCSGKGVPLLTPLLCSAEDRLVDQKDDAGLCHYVGTYCSSKVLGVCTTKKQSYCCFSSKLTRILQEQGRAQLGMGWDKPKEPDCEGFLVEEFQRLDLSRMNFSEVYAEFTEAARLPDEIETSLLIQERIADYYELHSGD